MLSEMILGPQNTVLAEIHAGHCTPEQTHQRASVWTVPNGASLAREGLHTILRVPWIQARLVCRSDIARTVLAQCFSSFTPRDDNERAIAHSAARYRLLIPANHEIPTSHSTEPETIPWRNADAIFWSAFANEQDTMRGSTRPYAKDKPLPSRIETKLDGRSPSIVLDSGDNTPRPIPQSANGFDRTPVTLPNLGRWLARFMRNREIHKVRESPHVEERTRRGFPEAGALGTTMLWIVGLRIETLPRGLWRYDADHHRLIRTNGHAGNLAFEAIQADKPLNRGQGAPPAGIGIVTAHMDRIAAQYDHLALYLALQNASICIGAAAVAGASEGIGIRIYGRINGTLFAKESRIASHQEAALAAFGFGNIISKLT